MNMLFEVKELNSPEKKIRDFVNKMNRVGLVKKNYDFARLYNNVSNDPKTNISIMFNHLKQSYKKYVIEEGWTEKKFEDLTFILMHFFRYLTTFNYGRYSKFYDEGKFDYILKEAMFKYYGIESKK